MNLEDIVEKAAYARPGYTLATFKEAALPVYVTTARVLTLEAKPITPIEEGCLRAIDAGLSDPDEICSFLGLSIRVLSSVFAGLNSNEQINYRRATSGNKPQVSITSKGKAILKNATAIVPEERIARFVYDPFLKKVVFISITGLFRPKEVKERGWLEIPLCGLKRPEAGDIPLTDVDAVVRRHPRAKEQVRELLAIRRIERRELQFVPAMVLFYRSQSGNDVQVAFYRDDGFSLEHEMAFASHGGPQFVGANHILQPSDTPEPIASMSSEVIAESLKEIDELEKTIAAAEWPDDKKSADGSLDQSKAELAIRAEEAKARLKALTQRLVRCHEHPVLLMKALQDTKERLLIISPWVTDKVVDTRFLKSLETLLKSGVHISIGYGLVDEGGGKDKAKQNSPKPDQSKDALEKLSKQYKNLSMKFIGNTHRKLLVSDRSFAVITSFNWLSFRGDPKRKPRDELGYLVSEPQSLEDIYKDGLALIQEGYKHPPSQ